MDQGRSSIKQIPPEIWVEIFRLSCPLFPRLKAGGVPIPFGRVCSQWRAILYGTPSLWARLEINWDFDSNHSQALGHVLLDKWLSLSGDSQLSLRFYESRGAQIPEQFRDILLVHTRRWKDVEIDAPFTSIWPLLDAWQSPPQSLCSLRLKLRPSKQPTRLKLSNWIPTWSTVTELTIEESDPRQLPNFPRLTEYYVLFSECKNLKLCRVSATLDFDPGPREKIIAANLRNLMLTIYDDHGADRGAHECLGPPFNFLETPNLYNLQIQAVVSAHCYVPESGQPSLFGQALTTTVHTLHTLSLSYIPITEGGFLECLLAASWLRRLDLRFGFSSLDGDPITDELLSRCSNREVLPYLRHLHLECSGNRCSNEHLREIMVSRLMDREDPLLVALNYFHFKSRMAIENRTYELVRSLRRGGIDIAVEQFRVF